MYHDDPLFCQVTKMQPTQHRLQKFGGDRAAQLRMPFQRSSIMQHNSAKQHAQHCSVSLRRTLISEENIRWPFCHIFFQFNCTPWQTYPVPFNSDNSRPVMEHVVLIEHSCVLLPIFTRPQTTMKQLLTHNWNATKKWTGWLTLKITHHKAQSSVVSISPSYGSELSRVHWILLSHYKAEWISNDFLTRLKRKSWIYSIPQKHVKSWE